MIMKSVILKQFIQIFLNSLSFEKNQKILC